MFEEGHRKAIDTAIEEELDFSPLMNPDLNEEQVEIILKSLREGLSQKYFSTYTSPEHMRNILGSYLDGDESYQQWFNPLYENKVSLFQQASRLGITLDYENFLDPRLTDEQISEHLENYIAEENSEDQELSGEVF
ncbi:MAG: hypothetical protein HRT88_00225 [Lentisphaeraceae bacterium]|nr:hypothetical protein [Lentisphaeraceae bacterium]